MKKRERFYCDSQGVDPVAEDKLLAKVNELADRIKNAGRLVFVSRSKGDAEWLRRWYGNDADKKLAKGVPIGGFPLPAIFESLPIYRSVKGEIVVTMAVESDELLKIEDNYDIAAILALPWLKRTVDKWAKMSGAVELLSGVAATPYPLPPCLVQQAFTDLTQTVNMSTGIGHPSDEAQCKTYLRALVHQGIVLDEPVIESFLFRLGWQKAHLDDILSIIEKINAGRSFQGGDKKGFDFHLKRWEAACAS